MKTNKNPYIRTHIAIIKVLLDGSKKTQNQIAKETEYEKSTISHALDYLERMNVIIREQIKKESGYTNKGKYPNKSCWLTYEIDNGKYVLEFLKEIVGKDSTIITDLQKSDRVVSLLAQKHKTIWEQKAWYGLPNAETEFKQKLRNSPKFFNFCLDSESCALSNDFLRDISSIFNPELINSDPEFWDLIKGYDLIFKACVMTDLLNGNRINEPFEKMQQLTLGYRKSLKK